MAEFTEKQVYEAFGLGEEAQEVAAPAQEPEVQEQPAGENVQEPAEPAATNGEEEPAADPESEGEEEVPSEPKEGQEAGEEDSQTKEQRRQNAARRRQAERQADIDKAVNAALEAERKKANEAMQKFFAQAGMKDGEGKPIISLEQFDAWQDTVARTKLSRELKEGKLSQESLDAAIGNHPAVKQAQELAQREAQAKREREEAQARQQIEAEIAQIHKLDASISSLEDLFNAPYGKELYAMTQKGYSLKDAHFLLNHKRLEEAKLEAARQQAQLTARSKSHMVATGNPRGGGAVSVPSEELAMFRRLNPDASDAEIQAFYNNYLKKGG